MKQKTRNSIVATFFAIILSTFSFAILIVIGDYLGYDWNLLYQGEGVPLIGNLFAIGIPAYLGAHWSQLVDS